MRKAVQETYVVAGDPDEWLDRVDEAFDRAHFRHVDCNELIREVTGRYRRVTVTGDLAVTVTPEGTATRLTLRATGRIDNVYAIFSSPARRILQAFKQALTSLEPATLTNTD